MLMTRNNGHTYKGLGRSSEGLECADCLVLLEKQGVKNEKSFWEDALESKLQTKKGKKAKASDRSYFGQLSQYSHLLQVPLPEANSR
jgi:hypothetical protein